MGMMKHIHDVMKFGEELEILDEIMKALETYRVAHEGNVTYDRVWDRKVLYPASVNPGIVIESGGHRYQLIIEDKGKPFVLGGETNGN